MNARDWDVDAAKARCRRYRKRILEISQRVSALHIAPAFSALEITDAVYHGLMRPPSGGGNRSADTFIMSKGHGYMAQAVILEEQGILETRDIDEYCTPHGRLGAHPDYGNPGIEATSGSLGHGFGIAVGMAKADQILGADRRLYVIIGDGELQEGSVWEAITMAPNLGLKNLTVFVDFNDYQGLGRTSESHPFLYPVDEKVRSFGWASADIDGHDSRAIMEAVEGNRGDKPIFVVCRTVKGQGVSYMQHAPIWHYRSPNKDEYAQALKEIDGAEIDAS